MFGGRAIGQGSSGRLLNADIHVQSHINYLQIYGGQSGTDAGFFSEYFGFP
jgi:hypothetical protein